METYWISGAQLGVLITHPSKDYRQKMVDEIIDRQMTSDSVRTPSAPESACCRQSLGCGGAIMHIADGGKGLCQNCIEKISSTKDLVKQVRWGIRAGIELVRKQAGEETEPALMSEYQKNTHLACDRAEREMIFENVKACEAKGEPVNAESPALNYTKSPPRSEGDGTPAQSSKPTEEE